MTALLDEHGTPKVKVLIAVPCGDQVAAGFAQDLALLMGFTTFAKPDMELALAFLRGTYLPRARAVLVQHALDLQDASPLAGLGYAVPERHTPPPPRAR